MKISNILPIIGIILFIYIIYDIGIGKISNTFLEIPIHYFILALILFIPKIIIYSYKWKYISKKQKMDFEIFYLIKLSLVGLFYACITPGAIGWHVRIYYLKEKSKATLGKCITNSMLDSSTGYLSGLLLALIGSIFFIENIPSLSPVLLLFFIFYTSVFVLLMKKERGGRIFNLIIRPLIPLKYKDIVDESVDSLYEDLPRIRDMSFPFILEIFIWIIGAIQVYIIALAFSINVTFILFVFISIISVVVATSIPISIGGLGVREGTFVVLLGIYGVSSETAFVISLSGFFVKFLIPGIFGWFVSLKKDV